MPEYELTELAVEVIGRGDLLKRINDSLTTVCRDVVERSTIKKARKVTIEIEIKPDDSDQPEITSKVKHALPPQKVLMTRGIMRGGKVMVNKFDDDPRQTVLDNVVGINSKKGNE